MKSTKKLAFTTVIALIFGLSAQAVAQKGVELGEAVSVQAEVVYIDKADRVVALRGEDGNIVEIDVPEEARNFDQLEVGDRLTATYYESVALYIGEAGSIPDAEADVVAGRSEKGEKPGGFVVGTVEISALVKAIDKENRKVTLEGPDGKTMTVKVDPSVKKLDDLKVGDTVNARITEAIAISVEK